MGLSCKPCGKMKSFFQKIDNELQKQKEALKPKKKKPEEKKT